jgi:hypothetical protein
LPPKTDELVDVFLTEAENSLVGSIRVSVDTKNGFILDLKVSSEEEEEEEEPVAKMGF